MTSPTDVLLSAMASSDRSGFQVADTIVELIRDASRAERPGTYTRLEIVVVREEWLPRIARAHLAGAIGRLGPKRVAEIILTTEPPAMRVTA